MILKPMDTSQTHLLIERIILGVFLAALLLLAYRVISPFIVPVAWAGIIVYLTWPLYRHLRALMGRFVTGSALLMTFIVTLSFVLPAIWVLSVLGEELPTAYKTVRTFIEQEQWILPDLVRRIPWLGPELQSMLDELSQNRETLQEHLAEWISPWLDEIAQVFGGVGRNVVKFGLALLTAFFIYRDGEHLLQQIRHVLQRFIGERAKAYLIAVGNTIQAVLYGLISTALVQGIFAGLGYWVAGLRAPVLLGAMTGMLAFIPLGPPLAWSSIGIGLIVTGNTLAGAGILLWGALVVSQIDNLVHPLIVGNVARLPYLMVIFAVLGGMAAFGLIGLFFGPVIIAIMIAVWREWVEEQIR